MRTDEFLDLYRELEDLLEEKYNGKKRRYTSVVIEYLNDAESAPFRDKIDVCREIRNLLTHNAKMNGCEIVEPSVPVCEELRKIIAYIKRPQLALDVATKGEAMFFAGINQTVLKIMGIMERSGFSHIPILDNGRFIGVFSTGTIFSYILNSYDTPITRQTTIAELQKLLPLNMHIENYEFASKLLTCADARKKFERIRGKNKRLSVIFITDTGVQTEPLLGIITPWDVLGEKSFAKNT